MPMNNNSDEEFFMNLIRETARDNNVQRGGMVDTFDYNNAFNDAINIRKRMMGIDDHIPTHNRGMNDFTNRFDVDFEMKGGNDDNKFDIDSDELEMDAEYKPRTLPQAISQNGGKKGLPPKMKMKLQMNLEISKILKQKMSVSTKIQRQSDYIGVSSRIVKDAESKIGAGKSMEEILKVAKELANKQPEKYVEEYLKEKAEKPPKVKKVKKVMEVASYSSYMYGGYF